MQAMNQQETIHKAIAKLQGLTQIEVQSWRIVKDRDRLLPRQLDFSAAAPANLNEKGFIVFPAGRQNIWLYQRLVIPQSLQGYDLAGMTLRLVLTWWAEVAEIFINGKLVQEGDLFDSSARILISENAKVGHEYEISIRLVSPGHDIGALMRSHLLFEKKDPISNSDPGWLAKEVAVLNKYLAQFEPHLQGELATHLQRINWESVNNRDRFEDSLKQVRESIIPLVQNIKQRTFHLLGHAHLDMAWLWTASETYEVAQRTFESVLNLQQDYPQLTFGHTSPALYQWIEINRPELFAKISSAIANGTWEALGGMWIEPDVNLISGESIIRQLLYGQQYYLEKFGTVAKVAWLPDSFGFSWQLPQLFQLCGIEYFVTGKLHWNDTTKFPHGCFWWQSPDGTKLLTLMSPPNVTGVMDTNPETMTNYGVEWETQTGLQDIFWLPGVGDHGGGPTKDMLEVAGLWQQSSFFPQIEFNTARGYLDKIASHAEAFPVYNSELYLELHRGCYTTHGDQKRFNRYSEHLLIQAELWATLGSFVSQLDSKWQADIESAWKKVLFNQFHDILPGTSIPEVFTEANQEWTAAISTGETILQQATSKIALSIKLPTPPRPDAKAIVVFNSLNWKTSQLVSLAVEEAYCVYDLDNCLIKSDTLDNSLNFLAEVPSVGYRTYWLVPSNKNHNSIKNNRYTLENQYIKATIDSETGDISSIYDKANNKEILSAPGNQLQAFTDQGQYWDAWNIDPHYEAKQLPSAKLKSIQWQENTSLRQVIEVVRTIGNSQFIQDYILEKHSPILKIATTVDWQETHVLVKAAFPLTVESDYATSEIACGAIKRTTKPQTPNEQAQWETAAMKWVDLTDEGQDYGVSLLNDSKYGYDIKPNQIRISLLRSPVWPDRTSDKGKHQFTYAVYPHSQSWQQAQTVRHAYELNIPLQTVEIEKHPTTDGYLPPISSLLDLSADNLVLMALKPNSEGLTMRCYECHGEPANLDLISDLDLEITSETDCLESDITTEINTTIQSWKVKTFILNSGKR